MSRADKVIRYSTAGVVVVLALVAGIVSYRHAYAVVTAHGESGLTAVLVPLTVDGLIYASSMVLLDCARRRIQPSPLAYGSLSLGIVATLAANVVHGLDHGPAGAVVAAWPAVALVLAYETLMMLIRRPRPVAEQLLDEVPVEAAASTARPVEDAGGHLLEVLPARPRRLRPGRRRPHAFRGARGRPERTRRPAPGAVPDLPEVGETELAALVRYGVKHTEQTAPSQRQIRSDLRVGSEKAKKIRNLLLFAAGA